MKQTERQLASLVETLSEMNKVAKEQATLNQQYLASIQVMQKRASKELEKAKKLK